MELNKVRQMNPVQMELGGKIRTFQFDMNAYAELENRFGSIEEAMKKLSAGRMTDIRLITWIALIHEEAVLDEVTGEPIKYNITPYQVGSWIKSPQMLQEVIEKLSLALGMTMPDPENLPEDVKKELEAKGITLAELVKEKPEVKNA